MTDEDATRKLRRAQNQRYVQEYRARKKVGDRVLRLKIYHDEIDRWIETGRLTEDEANDNDKLATAIIDMLP